jgi:large subunit ribosomal protein L32
LGALPKKRTSRARQGERRSHLAIALVSMTPCPHCHKLRLPHTVCPSCGYYKGVEVIKIKEAKPSA